MKNNLVCTNDGIEQSETKCLSD